MSFFFRMLRLAFVRGRIACPVLLVAQASLSADPTVLAQASLQLSSQFGAERELRLALLVVQAFPESDGEVDSIVRRKLEECVQSV